MLGGGLADADDAGLDEKLPQIAFVFMFKICKGSGVTRGH